MNIQTYHCPHEGCGAVLMLDTDDFSGDLWEEDGTALISCMGCGKGYTIAKPVSVGFGGGDE